MLTIKEYSGSTIVVGVSGGPDSMALLDILTHQSVTLIVAHMNYHHRSSADRDQQIVESYCKARGIECVAKDYHAFGLSNFQADARNARYRFFKDVVLKYHADMLMLAHHKDDLIETYLMQKESGRHVDVYGLAQCRMLFGMKVVRPLLAYRKTQLEQYCHDHGIQYGNDETNDMDAYRRNQLRHQVVSLMDDATMDAMVETIDALNQRIDVEYQIYQHHVNNGSLSIQDIQSLPIQWLRWFMREQAMDLTSHKDEYYLQLKEILVKRHWQIIDQGILEIHQNQLRYTQLIDFKPVQLNDLKPADYDGFTICDHGTPRQGIAACCDEFPLTVRLVQPGDTMLFSFGHKSLHRYFIDHKIPMAIRRNTLVVTNKQGSIIFASGIGCDLSHYAESFNAFMVQSFA